MAGPTLLTPALILGSLRYGETSRIVRLATREAGIQSAIAKGADRPKSRFGAALQLLSEGQAHLIAPRSGDLHILAAFDLTRLHHGVAQGFTRFAAASALAETAARFVPSSPMPDLYDQLVADVGLIEAVADDAVEVIALRALWRLIGGLGLSPVIDSCARDGRPLPEGVAALSLADGGLLCDRCAANGATTRLGAPDRDALGAFTSAGPDLPILSPAHAAAHRRLFARWVRHHLADASLPALDLWQRGTPLS